MSSWKRQIIFYVIVLLSQGVETAFYVSQKPLVSLDLMIVQYSSVDLKWLYYMTTVPVHHSRTLAIVRGSLKQETFSKVNTTLESNRQLSFQMKCEQN